MYTEGDLNEATARSTLIENTISNFGQIDVLVSQTLLAIVDNLV